MKMNKDYSQTETDADVTEIIVKVDKHTLERLDTDGDGIVTSKEMPHIASVDTSLIAAVATKDGGHLSHLAKGSMLLNPQASDQN